MKTIEINLSEENLQKTHTKTVIVEEGFMFKDLKGNPMMIKEIVVTKWVPKS